MFGQVSTLPLQSLVPLQKTNHTLLHVHDPPHLGGGKVYELLFFKQKLLHRRGVAWRGVAWRGVAWRGMAWRGAWRGVAWRGVAWGGVGEHGFVLLFTSTMTR